MTWGHPGLSSRDSLALTRIDHEQGEIAPTRRSNPFAAYHKTGLKTMPCRALPSTFPAFTMDYWAIAAGERNEDATEDAKANKDNIGRRSAAIWCPQPDAVHRFGETGGCSGRASHDRPPCTDAADDPRQRRAHQPWDRLSAFEPEVLPDALLFAAQTILSYSYR